jgi:hypothetical protein
VVKKQILFAGQRRRGIDQQYWSGNFEIWILHYMYAFSVVVTPVVQLVQELVEEGHCTPLGPFQPILLLLVVGVSPSSESVT